MKAELYVSARECSSKSKQATRSHTPLTNTEMLLNLIRPTAMAQENHSLPFSRIKIILTKPINFLAKHTRALDPVGVE
jgi:hypothetical protein